MDENEVMEVVTALRIKPGLRSNEPRKLPVPGWRSGFHYDRDRQVFAATVYVDSRSSTMGFTEQDVETRGKSQWKTDNVWRLSETGIAKLTTAIINLWNRWPGAPK